jgi:hypothetical protein
MGVAVKGRGRGVLVLAVATALVAAWIISGCGSDNSTTAGATEQSSAPLSKAQFTKQAGEICLEEIKKKDAAVSAALKDLASQAQGEPTAQNTAKVVEEAVLPAYQDAVDRLGQLGTPKGEEAKVEKLIDGYESALQDLEAAPAKATKENPFLATDEAAKAYGIQTCVF